VPLCLLISHANALPKIGLVLGRGRAHIGVLRLLKRGFVDFISGASIGLVVGALYALEYGITNKKINR